MKKLWNGKSSCQQANCTLLGTDAVVSAMKKFRQSVLFLPPTK